ncbi:unnamed protein product, partial [Dicrocoelium dendriticum]
MPSQATCGSCSKVVGNKAHALRCFSCDVLFHISCIGLSADVFRKSLDIRHRFFQVICDKCRGTRHQNTQRPQTTTEKSLFQIETNRSPRGIKRPRETTSVTSPSIVSPRSAPPPASSTPAESQVQCFPPMEDSDSEATKCRFTDRSVNFSEPVYEPLNTKDPWTTPKRNGPRNRVQTSPADKQLPNQLSASSSAPTGSSLISLRRHNLMVFHVPESKDENPQIRYDHDDEFLQGFIDRLLDVGEDSVTIKQVIRLGQKTNQSCRPLRITFANPNMPQLILSRLSRLKGIKVPIRRDLEPEDRDRLKTAVIELKRRTEEGETDLQVVNFRVIKKGVRTRINRLLNLQARPAVPPRTSVSHSPTCA